MFTLRRVAHILFVLAGLALIMPRVALAAVVGQADAAPLNPVVVASDLTGLAGFFLSLGLAYLPRFNLWWVSLKDDQRRTGFAVLVAAVAVGLLGFGCRGAENIAACLQLSAADYLNAILEVFVGSQVAFIWAAKSKMEALAQSLRRGNLAPPA